jgi:hypothetical protein
MALLLIRFERSLHSNGAKTPSLMTVGQTNEQISTANFIGLTGPYRI